MFYILKIGIHIENLVTVSNVYQYRINNSSVSICENVSKFFGVSTREKHTLQLYSIHFARQSSFFLSEKRSSEEKRFDERLTYEQYRCTDLVIYIKLYCLPSVETLLIVLQDDNRICRSCNSRSVLDPSASLTLPLLFFFRPLLYSIGMPRDCDL